MAKRMNGAIRAAGGVLWRSISKDRGGEPLVEVAVIHRPRYDDWSLPKGKLAPGESEIEGAVREVWEETGFRVRPLDERGRRQAEGLVRVLSRFEVVDIVSADFVRCVETVEPLSDAIGLTVKEDPLLSELGYPGNEDEAVEMMRALGTADAAVVACTQGDVIPDMLGRLAESDHVDLPDPLVYKKGSTWVLSFDGERLFGADYIPPPRIEEPARPV